MSRKSITLIVFSLFIGGAAGYWFSSKSINDTLNTDNMKTSSSIHTEKSKTKEVLFYRIVLSSGSVVNHVLPRCLN